MGLQPKKKKPGNCLLSRLIGSIIGAGELDFRVRDGNGYFLSAMVTGLKTTKLKPKKEEPKRDKGERGEKGLFLERIIWPSLTAY